MTKEEANKILAGYVKACNEDNFPAIGLFDYDEVIEAMTMGAKALSKPSLPSNLDEAAFNIVNDAIDTNDTTIIKYEGLLKYLVKAGAEWMAGQGITKKAVIGMATEEISINVSQKTLDELDLCPGDKVVVQIRKK